jgi:hypothetical protein
MEMTNLGLKFGVLNREGGSTVCRRKLEPPEETYAVRESSSL